MRVSEKCLYFLFRAHFSSSNFEPFISSLFQGKKEKNRYICRRYATKTKEKTDFGDGMTHRITDLELKMKILGESMQNLRQARREQKDREIEQKELKESSREKYE